MSTLHVEGLVWAALTDEHNLPVRLVQFVAGVACARLFVSDQLPSVRTLWTTTIVGGLVALAWSTAAFEPGRVIAWTIPCASLVLLVAGTHGHPLARTPLERGGLASYSFYIVHQPMVLLLGPLIRPHVATDPLALVVGILVVPSLMTAVAWVLYVVVERPAHQYGRHHFPLSRGAEPVR